MSSIIKRADDSRFEPYDFFEMESSRQAAGSGLGEVQRSGTAHRGSPGTKAASPLEDAQETVRSLLQEAERRAEEIEKKAYEQGYTQGEKDGFEYGLRSAAVVTEQLQSLVRALSALPREIYRDYREWFLSASMAVARKIVLQEISSDPRILVRMMDQLLREAEADRNLLIRLNAKDFEMLRQHTAFETWLQENGEFLSVTPDPELKTGSCLLESDIERIDISVDTQLQLIWEHLSESVRECEAEEL